MSREASPTTPEGDSALEPKLPPESWAALRAEILSVIRREDDLGMCWADARLPLERLPRADTLEAQVHKALDVAFCEGAAPLRRLMGSIRSRFPEQDQLRLVRDLADGKVRMPSPVGAPSPSSADTPDPGTPAGDVSQGRPEPALTVLAVAVVLTFVGASLYFEGQSVVAQVFTLLLAATPFLVGVLAMLLPRAQVAHGPTEWLWRQAWHLAHTLSGARTWNGAMGAALVIGFILLAVHHPVTVLGFPGNGAEHLPAFLYLLEETVDGPRASAARGALDRSHRDPTFFVALWDRPWILHAGTARAGDPQCQGRRLHPSDEQGLYFRTVEWKALEDAGCGPPPDPPPSAPPPPQDPAPITLLWLEDDDPAALPAERAGALDLALRQYLESEVLPPLLAPGSRADAILLDIAFAAAGGDPPPLGASLERSHLAGSWRPVLALGSERARSSWLCGPGQRGCFDALPTGVLARGAGAAGSSAIQDIPTEGFPVCQSEHLSLAEALRRLLDLRALGAIGDADYVREQLGRPCAPSEVRWAPGHPHRGFLEITSGELRQRWSQRDQAGSALWLEEHLLERLVVVGDRRAGPDGADVHRLRLPGTQDEIEVEGARWHVELAVAPAASPSLPTTTEIP